VVTRKKILHAHREASALANDIPEESGHFRFLRTTCLGIKDRLYLACGVEDYTSAIIDR
jgi:hypothetical protein